MKPPSQWTPAEAKQAADYVRDNPDDVEVRDLVDQYNSLQVAVHEENKPTHAQEEDRRLAREAITRPSEYMPPQAPGLRGFLSLLPNYVGGGTEHFMEPTRPEFDRVVQRMGGLPGGIDPEQAFRDYKDALWAQKYDEAQAKGIPVVRHEMMRADTIDQKIVKGIGDVQDALGSSAANILHGASAGLDDPTIAALARTFAGKEGADAALRDVEALRERSPIPRTEQAAGAFLGPVARLGSRIFGLSRVGGPAAPLVGGLAGGAFGAGVRAGENVASNTAEDIAGREGPRREVSEGVLPSAALGFGLGALSGLPTALRSGSLGGDIAKLEAAGGGTSIPGGVHLPKEVRANLSEAEASGENAMDVAAGKIRREFSDVAASRNDVLRRDIGQRNQLYVNSTEGKNPINPKPLVDALVKEARNTSYSHAEGSLPLSRSAEFQNALNDAVTTKVVPAEEAGNAAAYGEGTQVLSTEEAQRLGLKYEVPDTMRNLFRIGEDGTPVKVGERVVKVIMTPKPVNAEELDRITRSIDDAANVASKSGRKDESYNRLMKAVRETRDRFQPNEYAPAELKATTADGMTVSGYSALKSLEADQINSLKKTLTNAGVRPIPESFSGEDVEKQIGDQIRKYRQGEGRLDADRALEDIARDVPGGRRKLAVVSATRVAPGLQEKSSILGNLPMMSMGSAVGGAPPGITAFGPLLRAALFHADPLARGVGTVAPGLTTGNAQHPVGLDDFQKLLQLADRLQREQQPGR